MGGSPFPEGPRVSKPNNLETCNSDGVSDFDIYSTSSEIVTQNNTTLTYHETLADASDNLDAIAGIYTSNQPVKTIYARVENDLTGCAKITEFDLIINDGPIINQKNSLEICDLDLDGTENFVLSDAVSNILNGLNPSGYRIDFYESPADAKENRNLLPDGIPSPGNETIYARVSEKNNFACYNIAEVALILNDPPQVESYSVVQPQVNSNSNTVTLDLENASAYEYSLNDINGPYQSSPVLEDVDSGFQRVFIRDLKGCAIVSTEIAVLGYDNFFTPNNDGLNDFWQIKGITSQDNLVHIFDRYGKLLTKLKATERGWDGSYNGAPMPVDDYWFRVTLQNGQEFNGHFSLVR